MNNNEIKLVINKKIQASAERVYEAWINPDIMKKWFCPGEMTVPKAETDPQVGGTYLIHMRDPESNSDHIVSGEYEALVPYKKIQFNWMWKDGVDKTQVTIELRQAGQNETLLTLTHRGFSQQEFADKHHQGWNGCLGNLFKHFS